MFEIITIVIDIVVRLALGAALAICIDCKCKGMLMTK